MKTNKNRNCYLAFVVLILSACTKNKSNEIVIASNPLSPSESCYLYSKDTNTVILHMIITDSLVNGDLSYDYFQKDKSVGKIKGKIKGDTLIADFTLLSEGINTVREVAFLKKENQWIEGFGDIEEKSGKIVFKNKSALDFENNIILKQIDCKKDLKGNLLLFDYVWSTLKNSSIQLPENGIRLNPIEIMDKNNKPAYIIFSEDRLQVELFLPKKTNSLLLERSGKEGNYSWKNKEWELISWKGYVLKKDNLAVYGGQ